MRMYKLAFAAVVLLLALIAPAAALGVGAIGLFGGGIIDAEQRFSNAQSLAASAASTNIINLGEERRIGTGEPMCVVYVVTTALDGTTGDETYTAQLQSDSTDAFGSPTSVGPAYSLTRGSPAGTRFIAPIPPGVATEQYLRVNYTVAGTTPSGNVTAYLCPLSMADVGASNTFYADAITISI